MRLLPIVVLTLCVSSCPAQEPGSFDNCPLEGKTAHVSMIATNVEGTLLRWADKERSGHCCSLITHQRDPNFEQVALFVITLLTGSRPDL